MLLLLNLAASQNSKGTPSPLTGEGIGFSDAVRLKTGYSMAPTEVSIGWGAQSTEVLPPAISD
jgi:hypothetical protein